MKLLLLKTLLQRRARDEGFTLPMVIALGLVMLLLAAVSITTANEENLTAITQNSRSDALAIAEVGVARYRELLDRNRILTIYDSRPQTATETTAGTNTELWAARTDVCDDNVSSFIRGATAQNLVDSQDLDNDGDTTEVIGSYSLVSYDYTNNATPSIANGTFNMTNDTANNNARGVLTVKGRAGTATNNKGEAQIQVDIPIRINLADMSNLEPALWIGNSAITSTSLGNLTIGNGNVVIKDQASADGCNGFSTLASTTPRRPVISDSRNLPLIKKVSNPTATVPADFGDVEKARAGLSIPTGSPINNLPLTVSETTTNDTGVVTAVYKKVIFGSTADKAYNPNAVSPDSPTDCSHTKIKLCRYYYDPLETTELIYTDTDLLTDGIARTTLLLNRPLTIKATNTTITGQNVKIGSTSPVANDSNTFEIYVNGNNNITINVASGKTVTINGFIHAPQSTLTITGSGIVNINGSVWVNNFVNTTATVNISPDTISREATTDNSSTSGKGYEFYSTTASRTPRPITGSPINWKTKEVD